MMLPDKILFCFSISSLIPLHLSRRTTYNQYRRDEEYLMACDEARPLYEKFEDVELNAHVYPDAPREEIDLKYMDDIPVRVEDRIPYKVLRDKPLVSWKADKEHLYTLFFTGLEHNRTYHRHKQYQHWLVVDIPGCEIDKGKTLMPYLRPPGRLDDMYHMYVYYVFKQRGFLNLRLYYAQPYNLKLLRQQTVIAPFVFQHNMTGPVAGTFFFQWN